MKFSAYRLVLLLAALLCVAGCRPSTHYVTVEGSVLGTTFRIKARTTLPADEIYTEVMALDEEMKHSMSIFDETSLLSRINRGESDSLDSHLIYNILAADSVSRLSDGMYDITVKPLVEAWGFAGKEGQKTPNIDSILPLVGYRKIRIEGNRLVKDDPRIQLDFNSIGKGYMVDLIARMLERNGSENYLVTIAGSGRCRGVNEQGGKWRIGIETPYDNNFSDRDLQRIAEVTDISYTTSGNYRRVLLYPPDGARSHTRSTPSRAGAPSRGCSRPRSSATMPHAPTRWGRNTRSSVERAVAKARELEREGVMAYFIFATEKADGRQRDESPDDYETWASPALEKLLKR